MEKSNPIYAEITDKRPHSTTARLVIFGRQVYHTFDDVRHREKALQWIAGWNDHAAQEWSQVVGASADVMEAFIAALRESDVPETIIAQAIRDMQKNAAG